ncbi:MAG: PKD domain-containing protein [Muribaculaceae bacterium]|nr:PKD domain-containing protein [Muribaculaceae bacterium]
MPAIRQHRKLFVASAVLSTALALNAGNPYISRVFEYVPAPGQFINTVPEYSDGDSYADILNRANEQLCGEARPGMICLGAFGGYVVFGFDHPVVNVEGEYDFKIYGNAIISSQEPYGGSCEPGVVWVSADTNGNGLPDDKWYQLAGSEYSNPATIHGLRLTYHRPEAGHTPVPDPANKAITDSRYIRWTSDNPDFAEGYLQQNMFHRQSYWPEWLEGETLVFEGTLLPPNATDVSGKGSNWVLCAFGEGYADNLPDTEDKGQKIDWAVDEYGNPVRLPAIDFVKVQSGMLQNAGWLGETSTEVCGAEDLHPDAPFNSSLPCSLQADAAAITVRNGVIQIRLSTAAEVRVSTVDGRLLYCGLHPEGTSELKPDCPPGCLLIVSAGHVRRKLITGS